jgi:hypothetical protein
MTQEIIIYAPVFELLELRPGTWAGKEVRKNSQEVSESLLYDDFV